MIDRLVAALVFAHLVGDFFFQTDQMAQFKSNPRRLEGYAHATIHGFLLAFSLGVVGIRGMLGFWIVSATMLTHWTIDLRSGLQWWRRSFGQTTDATLPHAPAFFMLQDQAAHGIVMVLIVAVGGGLV